MDQNPDFEDPTLFAPDLDPAIAIASAIPPQPLDGDAFIPLSTPPPRKHSPTARGGPHSGGRRAPQQAPPPNNCIVLKNLNYNISQAELEEVVRRVAGGRKEFVNISLIDDRNTGSFRGMAFVNFHTVEDASAAMGALSKMMINGRKVYAEYRRLRPGEKERREMQDKRNKKYEHQNQSRQTFERDISAEFDADGNAVDKRVAFFVKRDTIRKADDKKRVSEKLEREKEREAEFRARLIEYRDTEVPEGQEIEDITFEPTLTSYERRVVHVLCDELDLGHISTLQEDGARVLSVTKDPERKAEWAETTAEIRAAANEKKGVEAEEKKKKKEQRREAQRAVLIEKEHADEGRSSPEWKKGETTNGGPVTKEELEGIKWFKPRSAKAADGEECDESNAIRPPSYKLYVPPRQPTGPDGTIGFQSRSKNAAISGDSLQDSSGSISVNSEQDAQAQGDSGDVSPLHSLASSGDSGDIAKPPTSNITPTGSQSILNPSVPAFTPSMTYAS